MGNSDSELVLKDGLEVEHILPQNEKDDDWKSFLDDYISYDKDLNSEKLPEELLNIVPKNIHFKERLGNLTLLPSPINKELSNLSFKEKLDHENGYCKSVLKINSETVVKMEDTSWITCSKCTKRSNWTALGILKREKFLTELIVKMWELPKIYCTNPQCRGFTTPAKSFKVDFEDNTAEKLIDADKVVCQEKNGGQTICGEELTVVWPDDNAVQYRAPTEYTLSSDSRRANN